MLIKKSTQNSILGKYLHLGRHNFKWKLIFLGLIAFSIYSMLIFRSGGRIGVHLYEIGLTSADIKKEWILENLKIPMYYLKGFWNQPERININIDFLDLQKLENNRLEALSGSHKEFEYVKAKIDFNDEVIKVKLRLKGDRQVHWKTPEESSYRVQVKDNKTLFGMRRFSFQKPRTRNYLNEWVFHEMLKKEGLPSLRYKFINVSLNGKDLGLYAMEEHFDKLLIENNKLREGPIIRFKEGNYNLTESVVTPFTSSLSKPEYAAMNQKAIFLLEMFRRNEMSISEVFDIKKFARFFAISDLLSTDHATVWKSLRFYYNPITSKLEPIGYDGHGGFKKPYFTSVEKGVRPGARWTYYLYADFFKLVFNNDANFDREFYSTYIRELQRLSSVEYLESFFLDLNDDLIKNLSMIYHYDFPPWADYDNSFGPDIAIFSKLLLLKKQAFLRSSLLPTNRMEAFIKNSSDSSITVAVGNPTFLPYESFTLLIHDSIEINSNDKKFILFGKKPLEMPEYSNINFSVPFELNVEPEMFSDMKIRYQILGTDISGESRINPWNNYKPTFLDDDFIREKSNIARASCLEIIEEHKEIFFKPGNWIIDENLIIPSGYKVYAKGGLSLDFKNSAKLLSYSPLIFYGVEEGNIWIGSSDSTGQGIIIINSKELSIFEYVNFKNLSNPNQDDWLVPGAVTLYKSPSVFSHCIFSGIRSEDALNIFNSSFEIDNTLFINNGFDAFDADYSKGTVGNTSFINNGNDAVDFSGSLVNLFKITIDGSGDKGISAGENSSINIEEIEISNTRICIAGKDHSKVEIDYAKLSNSTFGVAAFQKKPEFGPAHLTIKKIQMENIQDPFLVETNSIVIIEGKHISSSSDKVRQILYGTNI
jgi:hypothetical protein